MALPVIPNETGVWGDVFSWPLIGLHSILTPDGKILTFGTDQDGTQTGLHIYDVWDPVTNTHTTLEHTTHSDLFCSVALIIPGTNQILISGGDARPLGEVNAGIPDVNVFSTEDMSLAHSPTGPMAYARCVRAASRGDDGSIWLCWGFSALRSSIIS